MQDLFQQQYCCDVQIWMNTVQALQAQKPVNGIYPTLKIEVGICTIFFASKVGL